MTIFTRRAFERGRRQGRAEAEGEVGDQRRRGALNHAADRIEQDRGAGRP